MFIKNIHFSITDLIHDCLLVLGDLLYNNGMVNKFIIFIICVIFGCSADCGEKEKLNLLKTAEGKPYYWQPDVFPLNILVSSNTPQEMYDKVLQAAGKINIEANCIVFDIQQRSELDLVFSGFPQYLEYGKVVFKTQDIRINRLAETEVFLRSGEQGKEGIIRAAEVRVPSNISNKNLEYVIIHELMHSVGLGHDKSKKSIMYIAVHDSDYKIEKIDLKYMQNVCKGIVSTELDKE